MENKYINYLDMHVDILLCVNAKINAYASLSLAEMAC